MPLAQEVISRRCQQLAGIDSIAPTRAANLVYGFLSRQDPKVPSAAQSSNEINPVPEVRQSRWRFAIWVQTAVNPRGHRGIPSETMLAAPPLGSVRLHP